MIYEAMSSYKAVVALLEMARDFNPGSIPVRHLLECRESLDPYLYLTSVNEESTTENLTIAIILKWVSE